MTVKTDSAITEIVSGTLTGVYGFSTSEAMLQKPDSIPTRRPMPWYGSYALFLRAMQALKERGIPKRITPRSLEPLLGDEGPRVATGFGAMGWLADNGTPTPELKELVQAFGEPSWRDMLSKVLVAKYSFISGDLSDLTSEQLAEAFAKYTGRDSEVRIMRAAETFFLSLALACGAQLSDRLYFRATRAHAEVTRHKENGDSIDVAPDLPPPSGTKQAAVESARELAKKKSREWFAEQVMNLSALLPEVQGKNHVVALLEEIVPRAQRD